MKLTSKMIENLIENWNKSNKSKLKRYIEMLKNWQWNIVKNS